MERQFISRTIAQNLNPLIGATSNDTLCNLHSLLEGQAALIADRSPSTRVDGELSVQLLQLTAAALSYEIQQSPQTL